MTPIVSIVIPTYNRVYDLERALNSVIAQTYPHWEALVVDNYSSDNTDEMINRINDSRIKIFKTHNHGVIAASRNIGISHASGKYVAFLDSDDWWTPEKLKVSIEYMERGIDISYHDMYLVKKAGQSVFWRKARTRELESPVFEDLLINGNAMNNSSVVVNRRILNALDGFSEDRNLIATEDYDGWLRIAKITERFKKIPQTLGYYWIGGENVSNPKRTLTILDAIEKRYANEIQDLEQHHSIHWIRYAKGRAYYCIHSYEKAKEYLERVLFMQTTVYTKLKCLYMIFVGRVISLADRIK